MSLQLKIILFLILDILVFTIAGQLTLAVRYSHPVSELIYESHFKPFFFLLPLWILIFYIEGLYSFRNQNLNKMLKSLFRAVMVSLLISVVYFYVFIHFNIAPKTNIIIFSVFSFILLSIFRFLFVKILNANAFVEQTVLIGSKNLCDEINNHIVENEFLGSKIYKQINSESEIVDAIKSLDLSKVDKIAVESKFLNLNGVVESLYRALPEKIRVVNLINLLEEVSGEVAVKNLEKPWVLHNFNMNNKGYSLFKTVFDKATALILFLVSLPIYILILPMLYIFNGRPIFFTQVRTGYLNTTFTLVKLRTMTVDAEKSGAVWAQKNDIRITKIGKFLRKSRIDELPQLWNVLKGDMSVVGPRPERPEIISRLQGNLPFYSERHLVKPGVTGWAQINFGYGSSDEDTLKKLKYDLYYIKYKSILFDVKIILKTIKIVFTGIGR